MLPLGDKRTLAALEDGKLLFHMSMKFILPHGEISTIAKYVFCAQPPIFCNRFFAGIALSEKTTLQNCKYANVVVKC